MPIKKYIELEPAGDTEGHGRFKREIEVDQIKLKTSGGDELTLEPEEDGERWRVASGPDDLVGHAIKIGR
jgi:hypothetical protein